MRFFSLLGANIFGAAGLKKRIFSAKEGGSYSDYERPKGD